jgi:Zn finger protein HypA/HybF involved in hydrogenase expression
MSFLKKIFGGGEKKEAQPTPAIDLSQIMELAKQAQALQGETHKSVTVVDTGQLMAQATANMELLTGQSAEPRTQFVKKTTCHNCGGAKTLAPKTAYVYCDFCGSLTDYDFQKACENPQSAMPGPAYEAMVRETKDEAKFYEIQSRLFDRWVELCPNAVSPRAKKDEEYRKRLVEYMAKTATANEFDPKYQEYADRVKKQSMAIQWTGMYPKPLAHGETFWPLYETVKEQLEYSYGILKAQGILDLHPDEAPESLQRRMTWSMFCQGWLPVLGEADSEKMIADAGLKGEYTKLEPVETTLRHCGGCGGDLQSVPGAKAMICEECGTKIDVGNPEVNCKNCAGMISFPVGRNRLQCPYCQAEAQRMSW